MYYYQFIKNLGYKLVPMKSLGRTVSCFCAKFHLPKWSVSYCP